VAIIQLRHARGKSNGLERHNGQDDVRGIANGFVKGEIEAGKYSGEWKIKMCKAMKGQREVGVVTIVVRDQRLFVKTVEWEDLR